MLGLGKKWITKVGVNEGRGRLFNKHATFVRSTDLSERQASLLFCHCIAEDMRGPFLPGIKWAGGGESLARYCSFRIQGDLVAFPVPQFATSENCRVRITLNDDTACVGELRTGDSSADPVQGPLSWQTLCPMEDFC